MRIADKMQYNQVSSNVQKNRSEMAQLQDQAATQKRVTKPSDDPLAAARVLATRTEIRGNEQFLRNIQSAKSFLEFTDQSLGELTEALVRAKELAVGQASDAGANAQSRLMTSAEIGQIYNQAIQIGNRKMGERHLFAGFNLNTQPFNQEGEYKGDDGEIKVFTHKDSHITMNIPGQRVFLGKGLGGDGTIRPSNEVPASTEHLQELKEKEEQRQEFNREKEEERVEVRRLASINHRDVDLSRGVNIFNVLKGLEISLKTNDKIAVQSALDVLDQAISQVVYARSEVGSRVMSINNTLDSVQKANVDQKTVSSQLEDADVFQVMSDINKTDSTLKATLETSGRLVQSSLLDFLK